MRPGRPEDLPELLRLWQEDVRAGRQDVVPNEARLKRFLVHFDWGAKSRVVEHDGRIAGSALVTSRPFPDGVLASIHVAGDAVVASGLARWAVQLSWAAGATVVQTLRARDRGEDLRSAGMEPVRPWLRMDRALDATPPAPVAVPGFELLDGNEAPAEAWAGIFNRTFADHWRFVPRADEEVVNGRPAELRLLAATADGGHPVGISFGELETYADDPRPQPVGLISSVGTVPEHRRRGLASWLVAEELRRLHRAGARTASLYVDGLNTTRAFDVYRKLGFAVTFEAEVWEATHP